MERREVWQRVALGLALTALGFAFADRNGWWALPMTMFPWMLAAERLVPLWPAWREGRRSPTAGRHRR